MMPTIRTLLSGGELFGVGARQASYTHIDGYELNGKIAAVARLNGFDVRQADICQVDYTSLPAADHLHASSVCTRASSANVGATESDLDLAMADAICRAIASHKGRTVTIENVWAYRTFESFERICAALTAAGFLYDVAHLNSADYGVPQTRKRLILRAVRGVDRVPGLRPTHGKRGGILLERWNGWYNAIKDFIHELPDTKPAPWQLARMPKALRESMLVHSTDMRSMPTRTPDEPAFTVMGFSFKDSHQPGGYPRAYIIGGVNTQLAQVDSHARADTEPMFTISAGDGAKKAAAAWLVDSENQTSATIRAADEPAFGVVYGGGTRPRAYTGGRWVRMTTKALGRFQSVPDDYIGLTPQINGNGVPCLLARRIMESLRGCYEH